jgi:hypothetical protein
VTKAFYVIEDYTDRSIWDRLILVAMLELPSKPLAWPRPENTLPEANWTLACGHYTMATDAAYQKSSIPKPTPSQLPAIFCVDGVALHHQYQVSAEQAAEFIRNNL